MTVTVATTLAELDAIAARWDGIPVASPHAGRPLFTLVQQASGGSMRPHVTLIEEDGREPILVVGRVERRPMSIKAGYRVLLNAPARWLVIVAGGVVGARTPSDHELVVRSLRGALRSGEADILQLSKIESNGPLHSAALEHLRWYRRGHASAPQTHHRSDLSGGFDAFLAARSKGTRWRLRRRLRKLDDAETKIAVHRVGPGDSVADTTRILGSIAARSYQRGIGVGFVDDALHRGLLSWAVGGGPFHTWILSVDGKPAAYLNGVLHERTFFLFETAFDASLADGEPGATLMACVLEELAGDPGIDAFDYGFGDTQYKQSLSDVSFDEVDILEFAARLWGLSLNSLNTAATLGVSTAKRVLGTERVAAMRRRERAELAQAGAAGAERD